MAKLFPNTSQMKRHPEGGYHKVMAACSMKKLMITGFIILGIAVGFIAIWYDQHYDMPFLLNLPGTFLGFGIYSGSIDLFGDPHSSQAHFTIPWILRIPQVYVLSSVLFWGILGAVFAAFLKPKIIAWIMGIYFIVFGSFCLLAELGLI